jgi:hypothetical protein
VTTTTAGTGYTGTVSWSGALTDGKFPAATTYTATITLTPTAGYTLTGVAANFFTVAGALVSHSADSGAITAVFYKVGATGPGGGTIFYVATTPFACGPTRTASCTYLEAAPRIWNGGETDPNPTWATNVNSNQTTSVAGAVGTAIGFGYQNSAAIVAQAGNVAATSAAVEARAYSGNGLTDWYLPSKDELNELFQAKASVGEFRVDFYWSSSQHSTSNANAWAQTFSTGGVLSRGKSFGYYVRPIRAG